jgi:hypothetical protein
MMKKSCLNIIIVTPFLLLCCSGQKKIITVNDLSEDKIIIIGLIEQDYSQLKEKKIKGIELYINSKQEFSDFTLSEKYIPDEYDKRYQFIGKIGYKGDYELCYNKIASYTPETDNLLILMDQPKSVSSPSKKTLQKYSINDGKIINIGKVIVKYTGGSVEGGSTRYYYSFRSIGNDTTAMHAFKQSYPLIFDKYKNDVYSFDSESE